MISNRTIAILGGDTRQISLCERLLAENIGVHTFGLPSEKLSAGIHCFDDWHEAIKGVHAVVLPLPASPDGRRIHLPLATGEEPPLIAELFAGLGNRIPVAGGKFSPALKLLAEEQGVRLYDYFECEELQVKNALPTAEGAVSILMREVPRTVSGLPVAVTGYGRVAKALIRLLLAMNATVTVTARKKEDIASAAKQGCKTVLLTDQKSLKDLSKGQAVVFNTVPYWLFDDEVLADMDKSILIIDLASAPGGVDANAAAAYGIRVIWALSLPGKYAPITAGEIIAESVLAYFKKEGIL
ncbi:MAG: NAD(P)-binding domain-containing protein [Clostridia bacterium]|nr:NAD(P)-binding domain-containing protein [Clostridia bacterium]